MSLVSPRERKSFEGGRKSLDQSRKSLDKERNAIEQRIANDKLPGDIESLTMVLLGHPKVGKSSIIAAVEGQAFSKTHTPTPVLATTKRKFPVRDGFTLNLLDIGGQAFIPKNLNVLKTQDEKRWRDADIFVLVYACDDKDSFETIKHIKKNILVDDLSSKKVVLVCNKIERSERSKVVSSEDGKKLAEEWGAALYFVSAKINENIAIFDSIAKLYLEELLSTPADQLVSAGPASKRKKSISSRIASGISNAISIKKDKERETKAGTVGSPDQAVSPRGLALSSPRNEVPVSPREGGGIKAKLGALSLSGKSNKSDIKTSDIPFAKIETNVSSSSEDLVIETSNKDSTAVTESDEFMSEYSEESKKKIRAARKNFEKLGSGDGGWEQAKIEVPKSPR